MPPNINVNLPANVPPGAMIAVLVVLGIVLLLFGRKLYWAFIAIAGFLVGMELANQWLADKELWIRVLTAVGAGVVGAILGVLVQRLAFAIGGFFAGGYLAVLFAAKFQLGGDPNIWAIGGGIVGAIVAAMIMDWAIIVLSSLAGAAAILTPFQAKMDDRLTGVLYLVLAVVGIVFQGRGLVRPAAPAATFVPPS